MIDLRKYNIKTLQDAVEFLDLFEARIPQIKKIVKSQSLKVASLENRLRHAERPIIQQAAPQPATTSGSITGKDKVSNAVNERLEQLRSAAEQEAINERIKKAAAEVRTGKQPSAGDIGQLNVPDIEPTPPKDVPAPPVQLEPDSADPAEELPEGGEVYEPKGDSNDSVSGNTTRKEAKNETAASIVIKKKNGKK